MADISQLGTLAAPDPIEGGWDNYQDGGQGRPVPPAGKYFGRAPDTFEFSKTREDQLQVLIDPVIIVQADEVSNDYPVRFTRASAKKFPRRNGSMMGDYLRAHGSAARPESPQDYADAVEETAGRVFPFVADWEAYCKECQTSIKGMSNFPADGNGGHSPRTKCSGCEKPLYANLRINYFIAQTGA
jgi:hypothetical protein